MGLNHAIEQCTSQKNDNNYQIQKENNEKKQPNHEIELLIMISFEKTNVNSKSITNIKEWRRGLQKLPGDLRSKI